MPWDLVDRLTNWFKGEITAMKVFVIVIAAAIATAISGGAVGGWMISGLQSDVTELQRETARAPDRIADALKQALASTSEVRLQVTSDNRDLRAAIEHSGDKLRQAIAELRQELSDNNNELRHAIDGVNATLVKQGDTLSAIQANTAVEANELKHQGEMMARFQADLDKLRDNDMAILKAVSAPAAPSRSLYLTSIVQGLLAGSNVDPERMMLVPYRETIALVPYPDYKDAGSALEASGWKRVSITPHLDGWVKK